MDLPVNRFKRAILANQKQIGLWSHLSSHISTEILAHCGFDWLVLDMEHSPNELPDILAQLQAMNGGSATPVVRVPWNDTVTFKRLFDIGVQSFPTERHQAHYFCQLQPRHRFLPARRSHHA